MTRDGFETAKKILNKIEKIDETIKVMCRSPFIGSERASNGFDNGFDKIYLYWIDNDEHGLKEIILNWCNNEKEKLNKLLEEL